MMMTPIYMRVTRDKYELPVAVAESAAELAALLGANVTSVLHGTSSQYKRRPKRSVYKLVWIEEDEE